MVTAGKEAIEREEEYLICAFPSTLCCCTSILQSSDPSKTDQVYKYTTLSQLDIWHL